MNTISGKTEFNIFKNYYTPEKIESSRFVINSSSFQSKDDVVSENLRALVKADFTEKRYDACLKKYSECLRYATYGGRQFAMALSNRSLTYFFMKNYQNCLIDINLCLQADYPNILKPKLFIRKANCFVKLGNLKDMMKTIDDCYKQIQDLSNLRKVDKDNYLKKLKSLLDIKQIDIEEFSVEDIHLKHDIVVKKNQLNPNVSASIKLKYNKHTGTDYVAARDIPCGEVLFVDTAYSVGCITMDYEELGSTEPFICDYCYMEARNCIPCKICINFMYCSENCGDKAWTEFHQWECDMFRSKLVGVKLSLPYRTLIKAALSGAIFQIPKDTKPCKHSKDTNPYMHIYGLHLDLASFRSKCTEKLFESCEQVVYMVEFLKKADFFTHLMSTVSHQKDYSALVDLVGGLLLRHTIQSMQQSLEMKYASTIALENDDHGEVELTFATNSKFHAFCPTVSGVKYSCISNTSMYFNRTTCVVKACKTIKAGDQIFRSGFDFSPMIPFIPRALVLQEFDINCNCAACDDVTNNIDVLDTYRCIECGNITVVALRPTSILKCLNCNLITNGPTFESTNFFAYGYIMVINNVCSGIDVKNTIELWTRNLKKWMNPYHKCFYVFYKRLLIILKSKEEFNEALKNFKTCTEKRNGRFNAFEYVVDLVFICKACIAYLLECNESNLQNDEIVEMLNYLGDVVKEAKDISEYTFPPFLLLFAQIELMILRIRIAHITI